MPSGYTDVVFEFQNCFWMITCIISGPSSFQFRLVCLSGFCYVFAFSLVFTAVYT